MKVHWFITGIFLTVPILAAIVNFYAWLVGCHNILAGCTNGSIGEALGAVGLLLLLLSFVALPIGLGYGAFTVTRWLSLRVAQTNGGGGILMKKIPLFYVMATIIFIVALMVLGIAFFIESGNLQ